MSTKRKAAKSGKQTPATEAPPATHPAVAPEIIQKLRLTCLDLPEASEEDAWVGTRWVVSKKAFAHVLMLSAGWPPAYAKAANQSGPACLLTFRLPRLMVASPRYARAPFFKPVWFPNIVGMTLDADSDWYEIASLLTTSYRLLAPKRLAELVEAT
jgi:hypothetical protein